MRRLTFVALLLLVGGLVFAAGPQGGTGTPRQAQARTGECESDCDGTPDQTRDQLQLRDGSCIDSAETAVTAGAIESSGSQDRDRLRDGTGDGTPDQDRLRQSWP